MGKWLLLSGYFWPFMTAEPWLLGFLCVILSVFLSVLVIDDTTKEMVYRDYVDISVAVATPRVCPVGSLLGPHCSPGS